MKYRKKPVVIEAFQYDGDLKDKNDNWYVPKWASEAFEKVFCFTRIRFQKMHRRANFTLRRLKGIIMLLLEIILSAV